ncbi:MAG: hypothetical protein H6P95_1613 [Candidatus Aminicenantes bacterium]|nr:hypothetical protein [Candidatus Aminicenantes bacterium]
MDKDKIPNTSMLNSASAMMLNILSPLQENFGHGGRLSGLARLLVHRYIYKQVSCQLSRGPGWGRST